jgi:hypothetical protein
MIELTETCTPTGNIIQDIPEQLLDRNKGISHQVETYAKRIHTPNVVHDMNEDNKKAVVVMATQGLDAGMKYMISGGVEGQQLSYAEMRARYG